ncbi:Leucine-rich repeat protein kinase family protein [Zea mays]|uniref:Leucine-rich repeat protein kinase family protein n=1 Tax=Zea mays TaxID=4577 RepID=A0A1D6NK44_MAIZE|nr:Leucine-rich repeat protein kinase family protein [Zea mays]
MSMTMSSSTATCRGVTRRLRPPCWRRSARLAPARTPTRGRRWRSCFKNWTPSDSDGGANANTHPL